MWVINIVGVNASDTLQDKVQGETSCCRGNQLLQGEGGRSRRGGTPIGGSVVPFPGFGASGYLEELILSEAPNVTGL